jgi:hypothetical protein
MHLYQGVGWRLYPDRLHFKSMPKEFDGTVINTNPKYMSNCNNL